jgi:AraC-like DNA-binding protein
VITKLRIDRARQLLVAPGRRTLTDIAATCGFHDLRRFRLTFERHVGISPAKYRKERRPGEQEEPRRPTRSRPRPTSKHPDRLRGGDRRQTPREIRSSK